MARHARDMARHARDMARHPRDTPATPPRHLATSATSRDMFAHTLRALVRQSVNRIRQQPDSRQSPI
eukprot:2147440-Prymnesium_polylepis.1